MFLCVSRARGAHSIANKKKERREERMKRNVHRILKEKMKRRKMHSFLVEMNARHIGAGNVHLLLVDNNNNNHN